MSTLTVVGTLSDEIDLRFTTGGKAVAEFRVGEREGRGDDAKWTNFNCKAWGTLAENMAASFGKGDRVLLWGRMVTEEYQTKEGDKRSKLVFTVDDAGPALRFATCEVERTPRT